MNLRLGLLTKITYWPDVVWFCFLAEVATLPAWLPRWCRQLWLSCPSTNQGEVHSIPARDNIVFLFRWGVCRKSPYAMCCDKSLLYFQPDLVIAWFLWMSEWWNLVRFNNMQCWKLPVTLYLFSTLNCAYCKVSRLINHMQVSWFY